MRTPKPKPGSDPRLLAGKPIPGWRTMTKAQRYNEKMERLFHDAQIYKLIEAEKEATQ